MVHFRDTDPRPLDPRPGDVSPAFARQRRQREADEEGREDRLRGFVDAMERERALRPADPPGYATLVAQANRIAAERYPLNGDADLWAYSQRAHLDRAAFVAGYVEAVLTAGTIRP